MIKSLTWILNIFVFYGKSKRNSDLTATPLNHKIIVIPECISHAWYITPQFTFNVLVKLLGHSAGWIVWLPDYAVRMSGWKSHSTRLSIKLPKQLSSACVYTWIRFLDLAIENTKLMYNMINLLISLNDITSKIVYHIKMYFLDLVQCPS